MMPSIEVMRITLRGSDSASGTLCRRGVEHGGQRTFQGVAGLVKGLVEIEGVDRIELLFQRDVPLVELLEHRRRVPGHELAR